ncbi:MAG TPA: D-2-hydroxyacid dehydrogenase [Gemmatimonadales bacterium]|nr:D-2-hydroxyacid dehydrogenase [Gemmatimonadales bacterium]
MRQTGKPPILILPNVTFQKYHDEDRPLPYEATPAKVRDELVRRLPDVEIQLAGDDAAARARLPEAPIILTERMTPEMLVSARRLAWLQFPGSGPDHFFKLSGVPAEEFRRRGITVLNSPGISRIPVAEQVMALALGLVRDLPRAFRQQLRREWRIYCADELCGKTFGIIGVGAIGSRVAELAKAFGMRVIGTRAHPEVRPPAVDQVYGPDQTERVIREADILLLACPLTPGTRGMMGRRQFALMKPTAYFINVSRGENVDEEALAEALQTGKIAGAGLDTFGPLDRGDPKLQEALSPTSRLWECANVIVMPNNAASTPRYFEYFAELVAENYRRALLGEPFISQVA